MTKVLAITALERQEASATTGGGAAERSEATPPGGLVFIAVPQALYKDLQDEAAARNMRLAELLSRAVADYLRRTRPAQE